MITIRSISVATKLVMKVRITKLGLSVINLVSQFVSKFTIH